MAWLYIPSKSVPASACSEKAPAPHSTFSASSIEPFATWSGKPLQPRSLPALWKREPLIRRLSGLTYSHSTAQLGADAWICSLRASRARTSASPAVAPASMASVLACSSTSSTSPTIAMRKGSFWRTSAPSLLPPPPLWTKPKGLSTNARPPASWENWPTAGGTRNGSLFPRPTWAPATGVPGGSALPGAGRWDTPAAADTKRTTGLQTEAAYWTTPQAHDVTERGSGQQPTAKAGNACLARDARLWQPPNAHDGRRPGADLASTQGGNLNRDAVLWMTPSVSNSQGNEYTRDRGQAGMERLTLTGQAQQWPTPASRDYRTPNSQSLQERGQGTKGEQLPNFVEHHFSHPVHSTLDGRPLSPTDRTLPRRLNPAFACWLMGWPIWWTNPALTSCARSAMASYRCRLQWHLLSLCGAPQASEA